MTEDDIEVIIKQHLFMHKGRCECGEYLGTDPNSVSRHLSRKIYEGLEAVILR